MATSEIQIDTDRVRVTKWTVEPGGVIPQHVHEFDYVVVPLVDAVMTVVGADGSETAADITAGESYNRQAGAEHSIANRGDTPIEFVEVELR